MNDSKLVTAGMFPNRIEAEIAQGALAAAQIEAMISADDAGGTQPGLWMGGVRVLVREEDAEQAARILNQSK